VFSATGCGSFRALMSVTAELAPPAPAPLAAISFRRRLDWFDLGVLTAFACVSVWVLAFDLWQVVVHHQVWTGTDGEFLVDQMQYLAWIKDAAHHVLVSDSFVIRSTPHDYFQPSIVISGALTRLGVAPWLALLLWKPVAVVAVFWAVRAYTRRTLSGLFDRRVALVLALFFASFGTIGDEWIPFESWGYPFALLGIAAMTGALVAYDGAREQDRVSWVPPVLGMVASFSHPWQGELLLLIVAGVEVPAWLGGDRRLRGLVLPAVTLAATALPLLYYAALAWADGTWHMAQAATRHHYPLWPLVKPLLPLLIAAAPAYLRRPRTFIEAATRVWLLAAVVIYALSSSSVSGTPLHAFSGITIPLAVLSVEGVTRLGLHRLPAWRAVAILLVAAATIPASLRIMRNVHQYVQPSVANANFIKPSERRALDYLRKNRQRGGVLTGGYLGVVVPAKTGRHTYLGSCLWSQPNCHARQGNVWNLFRGKFTPSAARAFVPQTGARFVLESCQDTSDLPRMIGPLIRSAKHFGCASVYELRVPTNS
jgi:hypothetical protein